jgi:hypothetical protein
MVFSLKRQFSPNWHRTKCPIFWTRLQHSFLQLSISNLFFLSCSGHFSSKICVPWMETIFKKMFDRYTRMRIFWAAILNFVLFHCYLCSNIKLCKKMFDRATIGGDMIIPLSLRLSRIEFSSYLYYWIPLSLRLS